ncbi:hypothetical protein PENTCL1PPCAC_5731, partial [Pristionchus entomophagus]
NSEMPSCVSCGTFFPNKSKHMHQFTDKQDLREKWLAALTINEEQKTRLDMHLRTTSTKQYVCASHFSDDCYAETKGWRVLKLDAVPMPLRPSPMERPPTFRFASVRNNPVLVLNGPNGVIKTEEDPMDVYLLNSGNASTSYSAGTSGSRGGKLVGIVKKEDIKEEPVEIKEEPIDDYDDIKQEEPMVDVFCPTTGTSRPIDQSSFSSNYRMRELPAKRPAASIIAEMPSVGVKRRKLGPGGNQFIMEPMEVLAAETIIDLEDLTSSNLSNYIGVQCDKSTETARMAVGFLARYSLIENSKTCAKCGGPMTLSSDKSISPHDHILWRCTPCRKKSTTSRKTVREGSFFEGVRLTINQVIYLAANWLENPSQPMKEVARDFGISAPTVANFYGWFRDMSQFEREKGEGDKQINNDRLLNHLLFEMNFYRRDRPSPQPLWPPDLAHSRPTI